MPTLRVPGLNILKRPAPGRGLAELAASIERGILPTHPGVPETYARLRDAFDVREMRGRPIVIATNWAGPFVIVEGLTRLTLVASRVLRGVAALPPVVPLLLGVGRRAAEWPFF